jgi:hypothetical protein
MEKLDHTDWGSPVTFQICHHYACACSYCGCGLDGTGPPEFSLVIIPSHLRSTIRIVPVLRLYEDELESLVNLINAALIRPKPDSRAYDKTDRKFGKADESLSFNLARNKHGQGLGEYRLRVVGRGVDDILPADNDSLRCLVEDVTEMNRFYEAEHKRLNEREERERKAKLQMTNKTLDEIEDEVRRVNPFVAKDEQDSRVLRVLLTAAFFVGPDIERLVSFTGYSRSFIADVACRMHDSGLWADGEARAGHWFDDKLKWTEFGLVQDCLVADGMMVASRDGEHGTWVYRPSGRKW